MQQQVLAQLVKKQLFFKYVCQSNVDVVCSSLCSHTRHTRPHVAGQHHVVRAHTGVPGWMSAHLWSCQAHKLTAAIVDLTEVPSCDATNMRARSAKTYFI